MTTQKLVWLKFSDQAWHDRGLFSGVQVVVGRIPTLRPQLSGDLPPALGMPILDNHRRHCASFFPSSRSLNSTHAGTPTVVHLGGGPLGGGPLGGGPLAGAPGGAPGAPGGGPRGGGPLRISTRIRPRQHPRIDPTKDSF